MKAAFVFPGQGAQYVGMGRELAERYPVAAETFAAADKALGFSLSSLCWEGPEDVLRLTYHTQPALLTTSIAAWRVFANQTDVTPIAAAGHSLGEYTAMVAAGALAFEDAVQLVHRRGQWMDDAVPSGQGAMSAVLGLGADVLQRVCEQASEGSEIVELANMNCPGQIVISGTAAGVERAGTLAKEAGARRVMPLVVSGPFHCRLMQPAASRLSDALRGVRFHQAGVPVVANVDAISRTDPDGMRTALEQQLVSPVRWEEDVVAMLELGVDTFIEFGPGTVLSGLIRKVNRSVQTLHVENQASLEETVQALLHHT